MLGLTYHHRIALSQTVALTTLFCLFTALLPAAPPQTRQQWREHLKQERASVAAKMAILQASTEAADKTPEDASEAAAQLQTLLALDAAFAQHQTRLSQIDFLQKELEEANQTLEQLEDYEPDESKPYSFLTLENLRDELEQQVQRSEASATESKSAEQLVAASRTVLKERENELRGLRKSAQSVPADHAKMAKVETALQLATAKMHMRQAELEVAQQQGELDKILKKQIDKKIAVLEKDAKFSEEDRDRILEQLATEATQLKSLRRNAETQYEQLTLKEGKLRSEATTDIERVKVTGDLQAALQATQLRVVTLERMLEHLESASGYWKQRYKLLTEKQNELSDLRTWRSDVSDTLDEFTATIEALDQRRATVRKDLRTVARESTATADAVVQSSKERETALREYDDLCASSIERIKQLTPPLERFAQEIKAQLTKSESLWNVGWLDFASGLLSYEVAEVDDEAVTVSRVLLLILLIILGMVASYYASVFLARHVLSRLGIKPGTAIAIRSIFLYLLCIVSGVLAFRFLNIPMAAFAFVGGAAAIAIGFGSQDVMNNFMSGIILLTEQPIRVGDVIQIYDTQCVVTHIGLRSTRLRNFQNHELIIPNTVLIEKQVTNLTLTDNFAQMFVAIEVDRTESIEKTMRLMAEIARNHPSVVKDREPVVLLRTADTYYLNFEVHYTIEFADPMKSLLTQSQILESISKCFPSQPEATDPTTTDDGSTADDGDGLSNVGAAPGKKIDRARIEKEMKRLQALLRH